MVAPFGCGNSNLPPRTLRLAVLAQCKHDMKSILIIILVLVAVGGYFLWHKPVAAPVLPISCTNEVQGRAVITGASATSGKPGTKLTLTGCNFAGFEGDTNAWIENAAGTKGLLRGEPASTAKSLTVTLKSKLCQKDTSYSGLPCDASLELVPGSYKLYVMPWGEETKSNVVEFTVQ